MSAAKILHELEMEGVTVRVDQGALKLVGRSEAVAKVKSIVLEHKAEIINELTGGPSGLPDRTDWQCPAHARHRDFWVSDFGLKICATCHPDPRVLRAAWLASKDGAQ